MRGDRHRGDAELFRRWDMNSPRDGDTGVLAEALVLGSHVVAGFVALFAGAGAFLTAKGGRRHRRLGRWYVRSMAFVAGSALLLYAFEQTETRRFLSFVAVFSFYFVFSGDRVLSRKRPTASPARLDWLAVVLLIGASAGLVAVGGWWLLNGQGFGAVALVFGGIGTAVGLQDVRWFARGDTEPRAWFYEHLSRMAAGYIATVTAFSSVNFTFAPTLVRWLWPTVLGTPLVFLLVRRYRRQFTSGNPTG